MSEERGNYCVAGALLCLPPSKPSDETENDALPAPPPIGLRSREPVPGWEEVSKPVSRTSIRGLSGCFGR